MKFIPDLCAQRAMLTPDAPAFADPLGGRVWSFAEIERRVGCGAALLRSLGIGVGDRVAVLCHNNVAFFELLFACARAKAILVPLNWRQTPAELAPIIEDSGAKLMLYDAATADLASKVAAAARLAARTLTEWDTLCAQPGDGIAPTLWETDAPWYLLYTSGTTGKPKAVIQTAGMALTNMMNVQTATGIGPGTKSLNFLPLFHTAGINLHTLPVFIVGGLSQVLPKFDVDLVLSLVQRGGITVFFGVPAIYQAISCIRRSSTPIFPPSNIGAAAARRFRRP
ncbi:AMP-binding protein [Elstera litoralis]|uniref:AMP-binding protein n=1 Tax=Elstera litoralis TaxID=552518 RepID=UPI000AA362BE|nr:AMP-binding protein [Elstera litoralis]